MNAQRREKNRVLCCLCVNFNFRGITLEENWQTRGMHRLFGRYSTRCDTGVASSFPLALISETANCVY